MKAEFLYKEFRDWASWKSREFTGANVHHNHALLFKVEEDMWMHTHKLNGALSEKSYYNIDFRADGIRRLKEFNEDETMFDRYIKIEE
jgi:hypothetical protein